jgi:drug/metabolite transporter (DMT)-like permease
VINSGSGRSHAAPFFLVLVSVIWGWTFVLVKEGASEIGPWNFLTWRFALASLTLLLLFWRRLRPVRRAELLQGIGIGLALFAGYLFQTWGLLYTSATKSGFITGLYVILVPLLSAGAFRGRVSRGGWLGTGLSTLGLGLILFGHQEIGGEMALNLGDLLTLLCAVSFALQIILIDRFVNPRNYPAILVVQIGSVFLLSLAGALIIERPRAMGSPQAWEAILVTGLLATALAYFVQNRYQPLSTPTEAAIIFSAEPIFAGLFGYLLLGERLSGLQILGGAAIFGGIIISQLLRPMFHDS